MGVRGINKRQAWSIVMVAKYAHATEIAEVLLKQERGCPAISARGEDGTVSGNLTWHVNVSIHKQETGGYTYSLIKSTQVFLVDVKPVLAVVNSKVGKLCTHEPLNSKLVQ
jgi:hypothetical protein